MQKSQSFFPTVIAAILLLVSPGCALLQPSTQAQRLVAVSKAASYIGTMEAIRQNPELKIKFAAARDSLALLETSETVDVITVVAVLDQLPIKELRGDRASIIINATMILIVDSGVSIPLDNVKGLQAWVRGVREGMDLAIGAFPDTAAAATK